MKIVYMIPSVIARAGVGRVLANKTNYLADKMGMEIVVVTTDQKGRPPAFLFSDKVRFVDLGLNYQDQRKKRLFARWYGLRRFERDYRKALKKNTFGRKSGCDGFRDALKGEKLALADARPEPESIGVSFQQGDYLS